jgi:hypothetical protein
MSGSPLGKYSELAVTIVSVFLIVMAVVVHVFFGTIPGEDTAILDIAASIALGAMYGKQSAANGYAAQALAAHKRLDQIGAPPANDGLHAPSSIGTMTTTTSSSSTSDSSTGA